MVFFFKKGDTEGAPIDVSRLTLAGDPLLNTGLSSVTAGAVLDGWFCEDVFRQLLPSAKMLSPEFSLQTSRMCWNNGKS